MTKSFDDRLRRAARSIPAPAAPADLIQQIVSERAAGRRGVHTPATAHDRRIRIVRAVALVAVAASVGFLGVLLVPRATHRGALVPAADSSFSVARFFVSTGVFPSPAFAQSPPPAPATPRLTGVNGAALGQRRFRFRVRNIDVGGRAISDDSGEVRISPAAVDGDAAWRIAQTRQLIGDANQQRTETETLYVTQRDLRPLSRVVRQTPYGRYSEITIRQRFAHDSVTGEMTTDGGVRRPIARRLAAGFGPYLSDAVAPFALLGVDLSPTWTASLSIVGWAVVPGDVFYPVTLRVVGEERIETPAGRVDCWKVHVSAGPEQRVEWVRKSDGLALLSRDDRPPRGKPAREYLLLNP